MRCTTTCSVLSNLIVMGTIEGKYFNTIEILSFLHLRKKKNRLPIIMKKIKIYTIRNSHTPVEDKKTSILRVEQKENNYYVSNISSYAASTVQ